MSVHINPVFFYGMLSRKINAVQKWPGTRAIGDKSLRNKHKPNVWGGGERGREMHLQETHQMFINAKKKKKKHTQLAIIKVITPM